MRWGPKRRAYEDFRYYALKYVPVALAVLVGADITGAIVKNYTLAIPTLIVIVWAFVLRFVDHHLRGTL